jgi:hypothetical protein
LDFELIQQAEKELGLKHASPAYIDQYGIKTMEDLDRVIATGHTIRVKMGQNGFNIGGFGDKAVFADVEFTAELKNQVTFKDLLVTFDKLLGLVGGNVDHRFLEYFAVKKVKGIPTITIYTGS